MVKTRHSGDLDESGDNVFMTLPPRAARVKKMYEPQMNGYDSDASGEVNFVRRSTRKRQHVVDNFAEESSSDSSETEDDDEDTDEEEDEETGEEGENEEEEEENESNNNKRGRSRRLSFRALSRAAKSPTRPAVGKRQASKSPSAEDSQEMNGESGTRRSNRQRKLIYGSFNEKDIDAHHKLMQRIDAVGQEKGGLSSPERKRRKKTTEVDALRKEAGEEIDTYGRSTRHRSRLQRAIFGAKRGGRSKEGETSQTEDTEGTESEDSSSESDQDGRRPYSLREHKPTTSRYMAPINEPRTLRKPNVGIFRESTPPAKSRKPKTSYQSPARRRTGSYRRRSQKRKDDDGRRKAFHDSDSTSSDSSSGGDSSDDERRFQRRKAKSMAKARGRLLPMNFTNDDVNTGVLRDRTRAGASMADIDPMDLDRNVTFKSIGGLGKHLRKLKEMIVFPLLYPEVFDRFKIAPPRGVLFYGPPGTGKTLVARALANECGKGERKVAFFMRKGADCLSKWVGESERQLRLLFDQAYQMRPSVIFFDEIDGLAPVRSSKQDQIHSSLVSTLLALMDGLDNRGEIVVIGATNRIDSIDPALRRPGRFDREFLFPLPSLEARAQILQIHTKEWNPKIRTSFMEELATKTVGYCGADLKSLCTEAALHALRRRYPQIYASNDKLQLDVSTIEVSAKDFSRAMDGIVPTAQRSASSPGRALRPCIRPLLAHIFQKALDTLMESFPAMQLAEIASLDVPNESSGGVDCEDYSDEDDVAPSIFEATARNGRVKKRHTEDDETHESYLSFISNVGQTPSTHRPRMLIAGNPGQGQSSHVAPALLHAMEKLPVHVLDLPTLYAVSVKTAEESCADVFREARRTSPSIIYMPHIGEWWDVINDTVRSTFMALLRDVEPTMPLLLLATSEVGHTHLSPEIKQLFNATSGEVITMHNPSDSQRREFFQDLLLNQIKKPPPSKKQAAQKALEVLPKAPPPEPRKLTDNELKRLNQQEEATMRELRLFLRDVLNKLGRDRKFQIFAKPVDEEEVPDYYEIIEHPMDLSTMMSKIDLHQYQTVKAFLDDIDLICQNALEYNPDKDPQSRAIRHRACTLKDTALALMNAELDPDFEKLCEDIAEARQKRGQDARSTVPDYYFTKPLNRPWQKPLEDCLRGRNDDAPSASGSNGCSTVNGSVDMPKIRKIIKRVPVPLPPRKTASKVSPWCKPTRHRRRWKNVTVFIDEHGNEVPDPDAENEQDNAESDGKEEIKIRTRSSSQGEGDSPRESPRTETSQASTRSSFRSPSFKNRSPGRSPNTSGRSPGRSPGRARSRSASPVSRSPRARTPSPQASNKSEDDTEEDDTGDSGRRSSRSRHKSTDASNSRVAKVTVDEGHLRRLHDVTIRQTHNFNVEKLEKLHSRMSQCIYRHRSEPNKGNLIKDLETTLEKFCSSHW